jgi:hypothetical protein
MPFVSPALREVEEQISFHQHELLRLRALRRTLLVSMPPTSGLMGLPDELLVSIAELVSGTDLFSITAVCARLRTALLNTPRLWTRIDFAAPAALVHCCLLRADGQALHISMPKTCMRTGVLAGFVRLLCDAASLSIVLGGPENTSAVQTALMTEAAPSLEALTLLKGCGELLLGEHSLHAQTCRSLRTLKMTSMRIQAFPPLRALRRLDMWLTSCGIHELHRLLAQTPNMEDIVLGSAMMLNMEPPRLARLDLPALRSAKIVDTLPMAAALVQCLPLPNAAFSVHISSPAEPLEAWSSTSGLYGSIVSRLSNFWAARAPQEPFPAGTLTAVAHRFPHGIEHMTALEFRASSAGAVLSYRAPCRIGGPDPLLCHIRTLVVRRSAGPVVPISPLLLDTDCLPELDRLIIVGVKYEGDVGGLEDGILRRCTSALGRPLRSIEFRDCSVRMELLFGRLPERRVADSVTWINERVRLSVNTVDSA